MATFSGTCTIALLRAASCCLSSSPFPPLPPPPLAPLSAASADAAAAGTGRPRACANGTRTSRVRLCGTAGKTPEPTSGDALPPPVLPSRYLSVPAPGLPAVSAGGASSLADSPSVSESVGAAADGAEDDGGVDDGGVAEGAVEDPCPPCEPAAVTSNTLLLLPRAPETGRTGGRVRGTQRRGTGGRRSEGEGEGGPPRVQGGKGAREEGTSEGGGKGWRREQGGGREETNRTCVN